MVGPSCDVALNLAFVVATDISAADDVVTAEFDRALAACPQDPTALWLLGQVRVQQSYVVPGQTRPSLTPATEEVLARPIATFRQLQRTFPGSAAGWAGEADAELRLAEDATEAGIEPFTARHRFDRALTLYQRADQLSDDPGIDIGIARALAGLRQFDEAAEAATRATESDPSAAAFQVRRIEYLERAGRFGDGADGLEKLGSQPTQGPSGRSLLPNQTFLRSPLWSIGVERLRPISLNVAEPPGGGAGAIAYDFSFIPPYREDPLTGYDPSCREWSLARDTVLAGRSDAALDIVRKYGSPDASDPHVSCARVGGADDSAAAAPSDGVSRRGWLTLAAVAAAELGSTSEVAAELEQLGYESPYEQYDSDPIAESPSVWQAYLFDKRQNLWRFAGDLGKAKSIVDGWLAQSPDDPGAADRAGEIAFLRGDYAAAAALFAKAASGYSSATPRGSLGRAAALLKEGAAEGQAGHDADARDTLRNALSAGEAAGERLSDSEHLSGEAHRAALIVYYARVQLGDAGLRERNYANAIPEYEAAVEMYPKFEYVEIEPALPSRLKNGAVENNLALAHIMLESGTRAVETATAAVGRDQQSPIFLQTLAYAYQSAGQLDASADTYRQALGFDTTLFPAANDLGVVLAKQGRSDDALTAFRRAVGANPDYALGWFNLGVHLSGMGPGHYLEAQGALGRAARLDPALRDADRQLVYDADPYYSGLDLSRPLPAEWRFVETQRRVPAALTVVIVLLLIGRLIWNLGLDQASGALGERMFGWTRNRAAGGRRSWLSALTRPFWPVVAILATVAVLLWPLWRSDRPAAEDVVILAVGVLVLVGVYVRSRLATARRAGTTVSHYTWLPAVGFGAAMGGVGLGFAPLPAATVPDEQRAVRWAGPAALAAVTVVLLALGWWSGLPAIRALGASAMVMMSSVLLPTKPFDGAYITRRLANILIFLAMLAVAAFLLLGWI
jgi:tetratricopeptide (TPR) repeat protein